MENMFYTGKKEQNKIECNKKVRSLCIPYSIVYFAYVFEVIWPFEQVLRTETVLKH